jgi:hypothetical protein
MEDPEEIQFPEQLAPPATSDGANESASGSDGSSDDTARTLGIIGIIVGVIGLAAGVVGIAAAQRRA